VRDARYKYIFNSTADPYETTNLIDTADAALLNRYRRKLLAWGDANDDHATKVFARQAWRP
jgi:hypothetical protein